MSTEQTQREAAVAEAHTWLGTPYHHQGRIKGAGVDCATILLEVYSKIGMAKNAWPEYAPEWHFHRSEELYLGWIVKYTHEIDAQDMKPGDIIVWKFARCYSHGTIYIGNDEVIHSYVGMGCIKSKLDESMFQNRPFKVFSLWGKSE